MPVATGRSGSDDQADHDPGEKRRVDAGDLQGGDLVGGGHSGAAVDPHLCHPTDIGESLAQLLHREEAAVGLEVAPGGPADRAGYVTGPRIDRFDLAAVPFAGAGIEQ